MTEPTYNFTTIFHDVTPQYHRPPQSPFGGDHTTMLAVILVPLAIFGLLGNAFTLMVISTSEQLCKSPSNHVILSLCVSDLLSAMISPFFLYRLTWGYHKSSVSNLLCKGLWGLNFWTTYVTALHIFMFTIIRFLSVHNPLTYIKIKMVHVKIYICILWGISFLVGFLPAAFFVSKESERHDNDTITFRGMKRADCALNVAWLEAFKLYTLVAYSGFFYLPILATILLSCGMVAVLLTMRKKREFLTGNHTNTEFLVSKKQLNACEIRRRHKENQAILQISFIVGSFMIGYLPRTVYHIYSARNRSNSYSDMDWMLGSIEYICLRISECLNPILYYLASHTMRREAKILLHKFPCALLCCSSKTKCTLSTATNAKRKMKTAQENISLHDV